MERKVGDMDRVSGSRDIYSHRGLSQIGGNRQLLRVCVDGNIGMD
jgi:hypothetical protein